MTPYTIPNFVLMEATYIPSFVARDNSCLKLLNGNLFFSIFRNSHLTRYLLTPNVMPSFVIMQVTYAPSFIAIWNSWLKFLSGNRFSIFSNINFDLDTGDLVCDLEFYLRACYIQRKFRWNRSTHTQVIEQKNQSLTLPTRAPTRLYSPI